MQLEINEGQFKGHVILPDFLNLAQCRAFEDAFFGDPNEQEGEARRVWLSVNDGKMLPVLLAIVKEWHVSNVPDNPEEHNFPLTPRKHSHAMINALSLAVYKLWQGEEVPNE